MLNTGSPSSRCQKLRESELIESERDLWVKRVLKNSEAVVGNFSILHDLVRSLLNEGKKSLKRWNNRCSLSIWNLKPNTRFATWSWFACVLNIQPVPGTTRRSRTYQLNRPFYSCRPSDLAFTWKRGWQWPCFDANPPAFHMLMQTS